MDSPVWQLKQKSKGFKANTYQSDPPLDLQDSPQSYQYRKTLEECFPPSHD